jgi:hypothetical protein
MCGPPGTSPPVGVAVSGWQPAHDVMPLAVRRRRRRAVTEGAALATASAEVTVDRDVDLAVDVRPARLDDPARVHGVDVAERAGDALGDRGMRRRRRRPVAAAAVDSIAGVPPRRGHAAAGVQRRAVAVHVAAGGDPALDRELGGCAAETRPAGEVLVDLPVHVARRVHRRHAVVALLARQRDGGDASLDVRGVRADRRRGGGRLAAHGGRRRAGVVVGPAVAARAARLQLRRRRRLGLRVARRTAARQREEQEAHAEDRVAER